MDTNQTQSSRIAAGRLTKAECTVQFSDLHEPFDTHEAIVAAERCLFCFDAPCVTACPTGIDVPLFIRQIAGTNRLGAAKTILDANIMGGMCARVCPTETLCEQACVRKAEGAPVEIGRLQRYATDMVFENELALFTRRPETGKTVAIVGAGPAGLACAHALSVAGHSVTIFEAREKPAGLNEYGIAAYKAVDDFAAREADWILSVGGIEVRYGQALGRQTSLSDLRRGHDAVFLAMGLGATNALDLQGATSEGVEDAVDFIERLRQAEDKLTLPVGDRVVVIGGGMTAIDAAIQAKKLGARDVTIVYRRGPEAMKASVLEQELALTNGVTIKHYASPRAIQTVNGKLTGVTFSAVAADRPDGSFFLPCDQLLLAIGQLFVTGDVGTGELRIAGGRIAVDEERRTSLQSVWAGGDCINGGLDLTVAAVEDGKRAAASIDAALRTNLAQ
jgi:dihydropyrimidine dehydrogenase (NAD+) subunit PreT